jgi:2-succinyl-5-enolpyruvyl-6-hydroxy-3-cyclohexene-1-carboxylate synthase
MLDTFKCLTRAIACEPSAMLDALSTGLNGSSYGQQFAAVDRALSNQMHAELERTPWSDLLAFDKVLQKLPAQSILQMGNSSVVRYIQLFDQRPDLVYYGNRGTSGIDGCTATASGMAVVSAKPVTLISGDIAFLYDVNGLWHSGDRSKLKIVLINNGGGNIFKIIEGPSDSDALETLFEARHSLDAKHIAAHFGIGYLTARNAPELENQLDALFAAAECTVLEVFTREVANENVLKDLFKTLKATNPFNYGNT